MEIIEIKDQLLKELEASKGWFALRLSTKFFSIFGDILLWTSINLLVWTILANGLSLIEVNLLTQLSQSEIGK